MKQFHISDNTRMIKLHEWVTKYMLAMEILTLVEKIYLLCFLLKRQEITITCLQKSLGAQYTLLELTICQNKHIMPKIGR